MSLKIAFQNMHENPGRIIDISVNATDCIMISKSIKNDDMMVVSLWANNKMYEPVEMTEDQILSYGSNWSKLIAENFAKKEEAVYA